MKKLNPILTILISLILVPGCSNDDPEPTFVPGNVIVGFEKEVTLRQAYEFAMQNGDGSIAVRGFFFYSNLPHDSVDFIKNYILEKKLNTPSFK